MGVSAVHMAADGPIAPFFRFPDLQHPPACSSYLGERNIATFSTDIDSFDFKLHKPEQVIKSVMTKLEKHGKGIILMHDFQQATAEAMPELLRQLKAGGYKVVHMVPRQPVTTLPKYDEMVDAAGQIVVEQHAAGKQRGPHHRRIYRRSAATTSTCTTNRAASPLRRLRPEPIRAVGFWIAERRRAGHHLGDQPSGRRTERQAPMGMTDGKPKPR